MKTKYIIHRLFTLTILLLGCFEAVMAQGKYVTESFTTNDGLPSNYITSVLQDERGLLWFGTWRGLCYYDGYEFLSFDNVGNADERPMCSRVHNLKFDSLGNIWCITYDRRLYYFNVKACQFTDVSFILEKKFGKHFRARNTYPLASGVTWISCFDDDDLAFRFATPLDFENVTEEHSRMFSKDNHLGIAVADSEGQEWLGADNGEVFKWEKGKGKLLAVRNAESLAKAKRLFEAKKSKTSVPTFIGIPETTSSKKIFTDSQQNIWIYDQPQLIKATPLRQDFTINVFAENTPTKIIADKQIDSQIYAQLKDSKGRLWTGTQFDGLIIDGKYYRHSENDAYSLQGNRVFDIFEDSNGNVWVACFDGGFNLAKEQADGCFRFINSNNELTGFPQDNHLKVRQIMETRDGVIILSTAFGIVAFDNSFNSPKQIVFHPYSQSREDKRSLPGSNVMQTLQTSDGRIYISTMVGGLVTIAKGNPLKDNLEFETVKKTLNNTGVVVSLIEDLDGNIWLAREDHIERFNPKTDELMMFDGNDFGRNVSFSETRPSIDKNSGKLTFGIWGGTLSFLPNKLKKSSFVPNILFSYVQFHGSLEKHPILYADDIDVPSDRRDLTISFSALDYKNSALIQYAYKLDGEKSWHLVGKNHSASFNNLPCGHLRLLVKSTNADGVWVENTAVLNIYSHPTFWETWWAKLLYALILCLVVSVIVYILLMRQRQRLEREKMEQKVQSLIESLQQVKSDVATAASSFLANTPSPEEESEKLMFGKLMEYLEANIGNSELKVGELADIVGMNRKAFAEKLKSLTGMSTLDFISYLRIRRAQQLMQSSTLTISQISYEVGFSDPNYFSKVFKKSTGMSPMNYRKGQKEEKQIQ